MQHSKKEQLQSHFLSGFLGFWIRKYRISYLITVALVILGLMAAANIPKESSPSVKLGIISVFTAYPGTNPEDMDALVSDKIYREIKDIKGIDSISSSSSLGSSSVVITLKASANTRDVLDDVRSKVNRAQLPADAKTPVITDIETNTNQVFSVFLYDEKNSLSREALSDRAITFQHILEDLSGVDTVSLSSGGSSMVASQGGNSTIYDVEIIIPKERLNSMGLSLSTIANTIRSYNIDQPLGNFAIGDKKYDYRIEGKNVKSFDFLDTPISLGNGDFVRLEEIATIQRSYIDTSENSLMIGEGGETHPFIALTVNKTDGASIFSASKSAKKGIEDTIKDVPEFQGMNFVYADDMAELINEDYAELFREALITLVLVFSAMYLFVGFRDSLFATLTLPLAFLATFLLLYYLGYSLNFLTNFSFILSFGIAVDTIIVIVQAASAKIRIGFSPRSAMILALREYAVPIIVGVSTTIVVFIPMMVLPGIMGKFLSYIPITIFGVLSAGLFLAITVNSALYLLFVREGKTYVDNTTAMEYATDEEKELLALEREGKIKIPEEKAGLRTRVIHNVTEWYKRVLRSFLEHTYIRRTFIVLPLLFCLFGIFFLAPKVGFELFPSDDNAQATFTVEGPVGMTTEAMQEAVGNWDAYFDGFPEIKYVSTTIAGNTATFSLNLTKRAERKKLGQRDIFTLENVFLKNLSPLQEKGLKVTSALAAGGPPGGKAVGVNLIAENASDLEKLIATSREFVTYIKTIPGAKNVSSTSQDTPGQFVFHLKKDVLANAGIAPSLLYAQMNQTMNGITVGTVGDNNEDMNVVIKTDTFLSGANMSDVLDIPIYIGNTVYRVGDLADVTPQNAIAVLKREDGKIQITVDADIEVGMDTAPIQAQIDAYAAKYEFQNGITFSKGGENADNKELINAIIAAFFLALMVIFGILTLQFNSFSQPAIILYSVVMALPFVMIGLLITGNRFSLPFGIGFIAFTGIAVNHGIILISAINENLEKGMEGVTALIEAGSSRLEPMTLTTLTTALGMIPIALKDRFWSGMGFTIIFGIIAASLITLFVVKGIYYEIYVRKHDGIFRSLGIRGKRIVLKMTSIFKKKRKVQ